MNACQLTVHFQLTNTLPTKESLYLYLKVADTMFSCHFDTGIKKTENVDKI